MATFSTDRMSLIEAYRRLGFENPELLLGDMVEQNDFLRVAAVAPANKGFFNETLRAKKLGEGKITGINAGIPNISSVTDKVSDPVVVYEGASYVDVRLFDGVTDVAAVRNSEDAMNLAGFSNGWNNILVYGTPKDAGGFTGLAAMRSKKADANVIDFGGSSNLSSAYIIEFGMQGLKLLYAKGATPGISSEDMGRVKIDAQDGSGQYWAFERDYKIYFGFSNRNDAAVKRIANIDIATTDASSLLSKVIRAKNKLPSKGSRAFMFVNSDVKSLLEELVLEKATNVRTVEIENYGPVVHFLTLPIMTMDAITSDETKVA